ncbi:MAG: hypothetical protein KIS92_04795 [Planctomycetota bacterium]|nr:hypothetical protein [Planctomycetota bacterium]
MCKASFHKNGRTLRIAYIVPLLCTSICMAEVSPNNHVSEWSISGKLVDAGSGKEAVPFPLVEIHLLRESEIQANLPQWIKTFGIRTEVSGDGSFVILPTKRQTSLRLEKGKTYKLVAFFNGRFSNIVDLKPDTNLLKIENVRLTLEKSETYTLKVRVLHAATGLPVKNLQVRLEGYGIPGRHPLLFGTWDYASTTTNAEGILEVPNLPRRQYRLIDESEGIDKHNIAPIGTDGTPYKASWPESIKAEEIKKQKAEQLPVLYYVPKGMGIYWQSLNYVDKEGVKTFPEGTKLDFKKIRELDGKLAQHSISFEASVEAKGLVKTKVVESGIYQISPQSGVFKSIEVEISGMGSIPVVGMAVLKE